MHILERLQPFCVVLVVVIVVLIVVIVVLVVIVVVPPPLPPGHYNDRDDTLRCVFEDTNEQANERVKENKKRKKEKNGRLIISVADSTVRLEKVSIPPMNCVSNDTGSRLWHQMSLLVTQLQQLPGGEQGKMQVYAEHVAPNEDKLNRVFYAQASISQSRLLIQ